MKKSVEQHTEAFDNVLLMLDEFSDGAESEVDALKELMISFKEAMSGMEKFVNETETAKEVTQNLPRATQRFNQGKRDAAHAMGEMIDIVGGLVSRMREYHSYLGSHLEKIRPVQT